MSAARKLSGLFAPVPRLLHFFEIPKPGATSIDMAMGTHVKKLRPASRDILADLIRREMSTRMPRQWQGYAWHEVAEKTLAIELNWDVSTIDRALQELKRCGFIVRHRRRRRNRYGQIYEKTALTRLSMWARQLLGLPIDDNAGQLPMLGGQFVVERGRGPVTVEEVRGWRHIYDIANRRGLMDQHGISWRQFLAEQLEQRGSGALPEHVAKAVSRSASAPAGPGAVPSPHGPPDGG